MGGSFAAGGVGFAIRDGGFPTKNAGFPTFWVDVTCLFSVKSEIAILLRLVVSVGYDFRRFFRKDFRRDSGWVCRWAVSYTHLDVYKRQATISAPAATLLSIAVTPAAVSVPVGLSSSFTATGTYLSLIHI